VLRVFRNEIEDPDRFVITLELVPGSESRGRSVDKVLRIAEDAFSDGRVSAVSITDNPGGNPSLSPDAIGREIFRLGMDAIVHFTCRDMNRIGMESRALQLDLMGLKTVLALTGDYAGQGFGGQGAPVFDLDSVNLICALRMVNRRLKESGDPEGFFIGCAVSPFKRTEGETFAQYAKLCKKIAAGAHFVVTQLGYDVRKYQELLQVQGDMGMTLPTLASVFVLTPTAARLMNQGRIPGAVVTDRLLARVQQEWHNKAHGWEAAIERSARLAAVLKGLGYKGVHFGGIHHRFDTVARILDRMETLDAQWQNYIEEFDFPQSRGFYLYQSNGQAGLSSDRRTTLQARASAAETLHYQLMKRVHRMFFNFDSPFEAGFTKLGQFFDGRPWGRLLVRALEEPLKKLFLGCRTCGDCGIQHVAFLCPEAKCPKHTRNGPCGGSQDGHCEVQAHKLCVWYRAYNRLVADNATEELSSGCVPPRMWELNHTPSWLNFHLHRDHQSASTAISDYGNMVSCTLKSKAD
jgi:methylenetetrahydrofolate reductase (NADPH)